MQMNKNVLEIFVKQRTPNFVVLVSRGINKKINLEFKTQLK